MKLNEIQHALLLSLLPTTSAFAAALDRSGQSIAPFLQAGNYFEAGGVKYFWLGDAKAQSGAQFNTDSYLADFTDNHAIAYGMKIGYRF